MQSRRAAQLGEDTYCRLLEDIIILELLFGMDLL
jgi:hypothetical protein